MSWAGGGGGSNKDHNARNKTIITAPICWCVLIRPSPTFTANNSPSHRDRPTDTQRHTATTITTSILISNASICYCQCENSPQPSSYSSIKITIIHTNNPEHAIVTIISTTWNHVTTLPINTTKKTTTNYQLDQSNTINLLMQHISSYINLPYIFPIFFPKEAMLSRKAVIHLV